ncbi:pyridoxamine 5'-phosphate oxidase family protein [Peptoniphilus sp. GNH]|nr:pyridoxamine 5'-phosphate oxidase family protein [Peptoniphilus sp. GNH]
MKFTQEMIDMIAEELAYIATVDKDGNPNIGPKRTMRFLEDGKLIYCENTGGKHFANLKENGKVSLCFVKRNDNRGFRFSGKAKIYTDEEMMNLAKEKAGVLPKKAAVIIEVDKIYSLDSGPIAGKLIEG